MHRIAVPTVVCALVALASAHGETLTICTAVADADTGEMLIEEGDCDTRATAASTFKIAISVMGFDAGILGDLHTPSLPFVEGYLDWNPAWRVATDPQSWMTSSVVWYSQLITSTLGEEQFGNYVRAFEYGNANIAGDPDEDNGLTNAWLSSSLEISPLEQLAFLGKLVRRELPASAHAHDMTSMLLDIGPQPSGWHVHGKTGAGMSKDADGAIVVGQPWAWFVGWATKGDRTVVFARLTKDTERPAHPPALAAREALLSDLFSSEAGL